jgi:hypothetical protein
MYRIELSPGEETVFRSIEELAVAVKRGVVTPRARIYHNASSKWLPIQFHPHYKAAVSMQLSQAALVAGPPVKSLSSLSLHQPVEPKPPAHRDVPLARAEAPVESPGRKPGKKRSRRPGKPRRQLRIALVGALLVGGAQWVLSAPLLFPSNAPVLITAQRHSIASPAATMRRVSLPNTAAMVPVLPNSSTAIAPVQLEGVTESSSGPRAPSFGGNRSAVESATAPALRADTVPTKMRDSTTSNPTAKR